MNPKKKIPAMMTMMTMMMKLISKMKMNPSVLATTLKMLTMNTSTTT